MSGRTMHLNALTQYSICHHSKGRWKNPRDRTSTGYRDRDCRVNPARTLARGCFDGPFLADVHGTCEEIGRASCRERVSFTV